MKKTVFTGTINGQTFDNVADYNKCMMQLLEKGVEVQASSSTSIKEVKDAVKDTAASTPEDGVSLFPFFEDDAEYYLDALVTTDVTRNEVIHREMHKLLQKCYSYIMETILDKDIDVDIKNEYRDDIRGLIKRIETDRNNNLKCKDVIAKRRDDAIAKFNAAKAEYNDAMIKFNREQLMIDAAQPVINLLLDFYRDIEAEIINAVKENNDHRCDCNDHCKCDNSDINKHDNIVCTVCETAPQTFTDMSDWFNQLLDECGIKLP